MTARASVRNGGTEWAPGMRCRLIRNTEAAPAGFKGAALTVSAVGFYDGKKTIRVLNPEGDALTVFSRDCEPLVRRS